MRSFAFAAPHDPQRVMTLLLESALPGQAAKASQPAPSLGESGILSHWRTKSM
jgi:hypothetical protein